MSRTKQSAAALSADDIIALVERKHSGDVAVAHCKDGPTQGAAGLAILDVYVIARSWLNAATYGYEVKISRGDFLRDTKWHQYLPLCNYFSFAAPPGVLERDELPEGIGLYHAKGRRLLTVRAPVRREADESAVKDLLTYVLISRAEILPPQFSLERGSRSDQSPYWRAWLAEKEEHQVLGHRVGQRLRQLMAKLEAENRELRQQAEALSGVHKMLGDLGVDVSSAWSLRERAREVLGLAAPAGTIHLCRRAADELNRAAAALESLRVQRAPPMVGKDEPASDRSEPSEKGGENA